MRTITITTCLALGLALSGYTAATLTSSTASAATGAPLCAPGTSVTSLAVQRLGTPNRETFSFPWTVTVGVPGASMVATELCSLPPIPRGIFECPADFGVSYRLTFADDGRRVGVAIANPTGCSSVDLPHTNLIARNATDGFWSTLGDTIGLTGATSSTFAGTLR